MSGSALFVSDDMFVPRAAVLTYTAFMSESRLAAIVSSLRTADSVFVIGAGLSFMAGMPLAGQLAPLVWPVLDQFPDVRTLVGHKLGRDATNAKQLIGENWEDLCVAFELIGTHPEARHEFQHSFARVDSSRTASPSPAHDAVARLLFHGRANLVVSLNWDSLLESACLRRYGADISKGYLEKPHGDALNPNEPWILPNEDGHIPEPLLRRLTNLTRERPRTLVIVGYSERDRTIYDGLISPLASRWKVFRIGPSATGEGAIPMPAAEALDAIAGALCTETDIWSYIGFQNQRDLIGAVSGMSLGPSDVIACPRLPGYQDALQRVEHLHSVEIIGESGCGKSLTAYQIAYAYHLKGRPVLRLSPSERYDPDSISAAAQAIRLPKVIVLDNSQTLSRPLVERIRALADPTTAVIIATTTSNLDQESVRISQKASVLALAEAFKHRTEEVSRLVRSFDPSIDSDSLATTISERIDEAAKAEYPWQFSFILRGGWGKAKATLRNLRDFDRADLFLHLIALHQYTSLDAGATREDLADSVRVLGKTEAWGEAALAHCRNMGLLHRDPRQKQRFPHFRFASVVLALFPESPEDPEVPAAVRALRTLCTNPRTSLKGISWLSFALSLDSYRFGSPIMDRSAIHTLVMRCLEARTPDERGESLGVMKNLVRMSGGLDEVASHMEVLALWGSDAHPEYASELGGLLNEMYNINKEIASKLVAKFDPVKLGKRLSNAKVGDGYAWDSLLNRVILVATKGWTRALVRTLNRPAMLMRLRSATSDEAIAAFFLARGFFCLGRSLGIAYFRAASDPIKRLMREAPLATFDSIKEILWFFLGYPPPDWPQKRTKAQESISKKIGRGIASEVAVQEFYQLKSRDLHSFGYFQTWLRSVSPDKFREFVSALDLSRIDSHGSAVWRDPSPEFQRIVGMVAQANIGRARQWIQAHQGEIEVMPMVFFIIDPNLGIELARQGRIVRIISGSIPWRYSKTALASLVQEDITVAKTIARCNVAGIASAIAEPPSDVVSMGAFVDFLRIMKSAAPEEYSTALAMVDADKARNRWSPIVKSEPGKRYPARKALEKLLAFLKDSASPVGDLVSEHSLLLTKGKPVASRPNRQR